MRVIYDAVTGKTTVDPDWRPEPEALPPAPVPAVITRQQFFRMLARTPFATPVEALDAARTGSIPPALEPMFVALPEPQQTDARIMWATAVDFYRSDPLFALAVSLGATTDAQLDQWFTKAATY